MTIKFFDFEFNLLHFEPNVISYKATLYYNDIGTTETHFSLDNDVINIITGNKYVVMVCNGISSIVIGYDIDTELVIYGRTCNWLLTKRLTPPFEQKSGVAEIMSGQFVTEAFSDVSNFKVAPISFIENTTDFVKDKICTTFEVVQECLALQNSGHNVVFDYENSKWIYNVLCSHQSDLIIAEANKNAHNTKITYDIIDVANCGYFDKDVEDVEGNSTTESTYVAAADVPTGIYRWETILDGSTETEAKNNLSDLKFKSDTTVETYNIKYGVDYKLGDVVRMQITKGKYRKTVKKRIIGVEISQDQNKKSEQPIFEEV